MNKSKQGIELTYDPPTDRWEMQVGEYPISMHCGYPLDILVEGQYLSGRLERDTDWYVTFSDVRFGLKKRMRYMVLPF